MERIKNLKDRLAYLEPKIDACTDDDAKVALIVAVRDLKNELECEIDMMRKNLKDVYDFRVVETIGKFFYNFNELDPLEQVQLATEHIPYEMLLICRDSPKYDLPADLEDELLNASSWACRKICCSLDFEDFKPSPYILGKAIKSAENVAKEITLLSAIVMNKSIHVNKRAKALELMGLSVEDEIEHDRKICTIFIVGLLVTIGLGVKYHWVFYVFAILFVMGVLLMSTGGIKRRDKK